MRPEGGVVPYLKPGMLRMPCKFRSGLSAHFASDYALPEGATYLVNSRKKSLYKLGYQMLQELKYIAKHGDFSRHVSRKVRDALEGVYFYELLYQQDGKLYLCEMGASFLRYYYHIPSWRILQRLRRNSGENEQLAGQNENLHRI